MFSYTIAPYEPDAQLAYFAKVNAIEAIMSNDADMIAYGCTKDILFNTALKTSMGPYNGFDEKMFLDVCVLGGCNYIKTLHKIGPINAITLFSQYKTIEKVIEYLEEGGKIKIPRDYRQDVQKTKMLYRHQRVYNPSTEQLVHLSEIPSDVGSMNLDFLDPAMSEQIVRGIAKGIINPFTKTPFEGHERI